MLLVCETDPYLIGVPYISANIYWKSRNLPNTDTQNNSTDMWSPSKCLDVTSLYSVGNSRFSGFQTEKLKS